MILKDVERDQQAGEGINPYAELQLTKDGSEADVCSRRSVSSSRYDIRLLRQADDSSKTTAVDPVEKENVSLRRIVIDLLIQIDALKLGSHDADPSGESTARF